MWPGVGLWQAPGAQQSQLCGHLPGGILKGLPSYPAALSPTSGKSHRHMI